MKPVYWFSALLASVLIGTYWLYNVLRGDPHLVSGPGLVSLLVFPLAIYPAMLRRRTGVGVTPAGLRHTGWSVVWPASIAFGLFAMGYTAYRFGLRAIPLWLFALVGGVVGTVVVGGVFVLVCSSVASRVNASERRAG